MLRPQRQKGPRRQPPEPRKRLTRLSKGPRKLPRVRRKQPQAPRKLPTRPSKGPRKGRKRLLKEPKKGPKKPRKPLKARRKRLTRLSKGPRKLPTRPLKVPKKASKLPLLVTSFVRTPGSLPTGCFFLASYGFFPTSGSTLSRSQIFRNFTGLP